VVPLYAKIENPLEITGHDAQKVSDDTALQAKTLRDAKAKGYDGVILRDVDEGIGETHSGDTYIVFNPRQVKSSEKNRGTYDPTNPDITANITRKQALETNVPVDLPTRPEFEEAVKNTPSAKLTPEGLLVKVVRFQKEDQEGEQSVRTGVFYLPEGSPNAKHYKTGKVGYGGIEKMQGETLLRKPLFVKGATGGKAPEAAYDAIKGKGAMKQLDRDVMSIVTSQRVLKDRNLEYVFKENVSNFLRNHGSDPNMAWYIVANSRQGNQLRYALQENVIAHVVRDAGYDSVLGFSKGRSGPFISEVFDVREQTYPSKNWESEVHEKFQKSANLSQKKPLSLSEIKREGALRNPKNIRVTDPNGMTHIFANQAQADAFKKSAGIQ
jgi:hypothetical protein